MAIPQEDSRSWLARIYQENFSFLWRCLRRLGVFERALEDAVHDVFVVAYRRAEDFDQSRPVRPWLAGIACKVASDFRRRACNSRETVVEPAHFTQDQQSQGAFEEPAMDDATARIYEKQQREILLQSLAKLDDDQRNAIVLHDLEGMSVPEIADALGIFPNTIYSRLRLGRARLLTEVQRAAGNMPRATTSTQLAANVATAAKTAMHSTAHNAAHVVNQGNSDFSAPVSDSSARPPLAVLKGGRL